MRRRPAFLGAHQRRRHLFMGLQRRWRLGENGGSGSGKRTRAGGFWEHGPSAGGQDYSGILLFLGSSFSYAFLMPAVRGVSLFFVQSVAASS